MIWRGSALSRPRMSRSVARNGAARASKVATTPRRPRDGGSADEGRKVVRSCRMVILIAFEILQEGAERAREAVQLGSGGLVGGRKVDHGGVAPSRAGRRTQGFRAPEGEGGVDGLGVEGEPFPVLQPGERGSRAATRERSAVGCSPATAAVRRGTAFGSPGSWARMMFKRLVGDQAHEVEVTTEGAAWSKSTASSAVPPFRSRRKRTRR